MGCWKDAFRASQLVRKDARLTVFVYGKKSLSNIEDDLLSVILMCLWILLCIPWSKPVTDDVGVVPTEMQGNWSYILCKQAVEINFTTLWKCDS